METQPVVSLLPNGYLVTVCRTQLQFANTGGSGTSIIGLQPIGDFSRAGYLPDFGQRVVELGVSSKRGARLFNLPLPTGIVFIDKSFTGPIAYQIALTKQDNPSPLLNDTSFQAIKLRTSTYDLSDLVRQLRGTSKLGNVISNQIISPKAAPRVEPFGLPLYIPENSVQVVNIDFRYVVPKEFDLSDSVVQRRMVRDGIDPKVGFRLSFPDISPTEIAPQLCKGTITVPE